MPTQDDQSMMPIAATRAEVAAQPQTITRVLDDQRATIKSLAQTLVERQTRELILVGSGDSWFASLACRLAFELYAGLPVEPLQAYEYAAYGRPSLGPTTAALVISSSGRPTTTWDALDRVLATGAYVVGITDNPYAGNPFHEKPPLSIVPGASKKGWPAQTTTATIALLIDLAIEIGRSRNHLAPAEADQLSAQLRDMPSKILKAVDNAQTWAEDLAQELNDHLVRHVYTCVGGGPSLGVAYVAAALLAEGPQELGLALPVEEFHHGLRIATLRPDDVVLLIAPTGQVSRRNLETAQSVTTWGARLIAIVDDQDTAIRALGGTPFVIPSVPEPMSPLLTLPPLHRLSIELATAKVAGGYTRPQSVP
ncbi:MAG: SIS domain-containing protein [Herpetosiphonaceae bacterium]|nr:SIS domain-containing protein [Herpetosiphonaceae bacterium]